MEYVCRIATREEMERRWDDQIAHCAADRALWTAWKEEALRNAADGTSLPYYGFLGDLIVCEATAILRPNSEQRGEDLVGPRTAYLCAFRTLPGYRGKGYMSRLMRFLLEDLRNRGYLRATLGVEPQEAENRNIYRHWGFSEFIRSARESYPDGTVIDVLYYGKDL